jgi:hypothetical protein
VSACEREWGSLLLCESECESESVHVSLLLGECEYEPECELVSMRVSERESVRASWASTTCERDKRV